MWQDPVVVQFRGLHRNCLGVTEEKYGKPVSRSVSGAIFKPCSYRVHARGTTAWAKFTWFTSDVTPQSDKHECHGGYSTQKLKGNATTWPPGKYEYHITSLPQKLELALHIDPKRRTSILLTQMFFCELTENLSIITQWEKGCKLKGFMAAKYIFPEPTYRIRHRTDRHCFASAQHYESTQEIWWRQRRFVVD